MPALALAVSGAMAAGCAEQEPLQSPETGTVSQAISSLPDLLVAPGASRVVNTYAPLAADAKVGDTVLAISPAALAALNLAPGDLLMIHQAQGAQIASTDDGGYGAVSSLGGAGLYEVFRVDGTDPSKAQVQISAGCGLRNGYTVAGKTQVVRVPRYHNVVVQPSANGLARGTLTAQPWNGTTGGILALRADTVSVDGAVDVSGTGFRGGSPNAGTGQFVDQLEYRSATQLVGGEKGESVAGAQADYDALGGRWGRGAPANGGGGGNNTNSGGGGGANAGDTSAYTGDGVMGNTAMYQAAWKLDPYYVAKNAFAASSGGGRGGYTFGNQAQDPTVVAPENAAWGGDLRRERGGRGGHPLAPDVVSRLFFGGGGGGGDANDNQGGRGGAGGGIAYLLANRITAATGGCVLANGNPGQNSGADGAGGGGGGGAVVLGSPAINGALVEAVGGRGGDSNAAGVATFGSGGGGGGGYVALPASASQQPQVSSGTAGITSSTSAATFPMNGATSGGAGLTRTLTLPLPVCLPADLAVKFTGSPAQVRINTPVQYAALVSNAGPEVATNLQLAIAVPPGTTVAAEPTGGDWKCVRAADVYTCTLASLAVGATAPQLSFTFDARPESPVQLISTATITAENVDADKNNNSATVSIDIDRTEVHGNGFGCSATGRGAAAGGTLGWVSLAAGLAAGLALFGRRRRRGAALP